MSERILVIGDVIDDIIVIPGRAIRHDTDTPASISKRAGGSSANTAAWLGFAGADVDFYGCVGEADLARHSHELAQFGVRTFLNPDEIHPTGTIVILVEGEARELYSELREKRASIEPDQFAQALVEPLQGRLLEQQGQGRGRASSHRSTAALCRASSPAWCGRAGGAIGTVSRSTPKPFIQVCIRASSQIARLRDRA